MTKIERFEDINAWMEARKLMQHVYQVSKVNGLAKDLALRDQMQRATVSIMANIAEGFDSCSSREFIRFPGYALRSTTELQSHLYIALDQNYLNKQEFEELFILTVNCKNLIIGFIRYLRSSPKDQPRTSNIEHGTLNND